MEEEKIENTAPEKDKGGFKQSLWEFVKFFAIAAIIIIPIRLWVAQPFIVSGASMSPSFESGEYLVIDEFSYHFRQPQRGEVIIFRYPEDLSKFFIKRVIGLPNEEVKINGDQIYIYNDDFPEGILINESYLQHKLPTGEMNIQLGPDEYFVLGDNRPVSSDSRIWGAVPKEDIIGRAWIRLWPFQKATVLF